MDAMILTVCIIAVFLLVLFFVRLRQQNRSSGIKSDPLQSNYKPPEGYRIDRRKADLDMKVFGKNYFYKHLNAGYYDVPDEFYAMKNKNSKK